MLRCPISYTIYYTGNEEVMAKRLAGSNWFNGILKYFAQFNHCTCICGLSVVNTMEDGNLSNYWEEVWDDEHVYYFNEKTEKSVWDVSYFMIRMFEL